MIRHDEPFHVLAIMPAVSFLLFEDYGFHHVDCADVPGCECGYSHLIPSVEVLADSEFLEESEAEEILEKAERIRELPEGQVAKAMEKLAIEVHELLDDRAAYEAAEGRAHTNFRFEDDPPPELFDRLNPRAAD